MKKTQLDFLEILFNPNEQICVSTGKYGYHSLSIDEVKSGEFTLLSPNPDIFPAKVTFDKINLVAINPIKGWRNDENATAYRTFLVEMDDSSLHEQMEYVKGLGMPYSVCVFSGSKSLHFGITLDEDLPSENYYRFLAEWILAIVKRADQKTKNPSRSIRFPDNIRDGGDMQRLVQIKGRVKKNDLYAWLNNFEHLKPVMRTESDNEDVVIEGGKVDDKILAEIASGDIDFSEGRNNTWFRLAGHFARAGIPMETTLEFFSAHFIPDRDFKIKELKTAVKSSYKRLNKLIAKRSKV